MKLRLLILGLLVLSALGGLVVSHAHWLVTGPKDPRFVRFMRRYDRRDSAKDILPPHGTSVDHRGESIEIAEPGSTFQHLLDDLQLVSGAAVPLTINRVLQEKAESLMKGKNGAVVVLEPATGRIRALVNAPRAAYLNRPLNGLYPPGSTFKVFMAAAALSAGLDPVFNCPATGWRPNRSSPAIRDMEAAEAVRRKKVWKGFGKIGMGEALMHSSNTYFAQLGASLGTERFDAVVTAAKLREPVTLAASRATQLTSAAGGVPEGVSMATLAPVAIGQGALHLSPLAVALFTAAVANDGVMLVPLVLAESKPTLRARPFSFESCAQVKRMMRGVVRAGTGRGCDIPGLDVCGKTGTAQTGKGKDHAWFTCFAPEKTPRLVVTVLVEHGGFGATAALPVAREILRTAQQEGWFE